MGLGDREPLLNVQDRGGIDGRINGDLTELKSGVAGDDGHECSRQNSEEGGNAHGAPGFLGEGSIAAGVYTLAAMSLGVGVFVLPLVFKSMGLVSGVLAIAILGVWSFWMQVRCPACCIPRVHAMTVCRLQ
eukprot:m.1064480 g.1064480  ORF g.1064480 m.1064480 type:complete len:131 (-) comp24218_c2_seq33:5659-6051(-)